MNKYKKLAVQTTSASANLTIVLQRFSFAFMLNGKRRAKLCLCPKVDNFVAFQLAYFT